MHISDACISNFYTLFIMIEFIFWIILEFGRQCMQYGWLWLNNLQNMLTSFILNQELFIVLYVNYASLSEIFGY